MRAGYILVQTTHACGIYSCANDTCLRWGEVPPCRLPTTLGRARAGVLRSEPRTGVSDPLRRKEGGREHQVRGQCDLFLLRRLENLVFMASKHRAELVARFRSRLGFKSVPSALKAFSSPLLSSNLLEQSIAKMWVIDRVPPEPDKSVPVSFRKTTSYWPPISAQIQAKAKTVARITEHKRAKPVESQTQSAFDARLGQDGFG